MTKQQLLDTITNSGWNIINNRQTGVEGNLEHWAVSIYKKDGDVILRQWIHYYIENGKAYWQDRNPFKTEAPTPAQIKETELTRLQTKAKEIAELVKIGLEDQSTLDAIKIEYDELKNN